MYTKSKYIPNLDEVEEIDAFVVAFLVLISLFFSPLQLFYIVKMMCHVCGC